MIPYRSLYRRSLARAFFHQKRRFALKRIGENSIEIVRQRYVEASLKAADAAVRYYCLATYLKDRYIREYGMELETTTRTRVPA